MSRESIARWRPGQLYNLRFRDKNRKTIYLWYQLPSNKGFDTLRSLSLGEDLILLGWVNVPIDGDNYVEVITEDGLLGFLYIPLLDFSSPPTENDNGSL